MKLAISIASVLVGVVFVSVGSSVGYAQSGTTPTVTTDTPAEATTQSAPPTADAKKELNTRLEERRNRIKTKLNAADSARIKGRCVAAQAKINNLSKKLNDDKTPFQTKYDSFLKRLQELSQTRKTSGQDTAELDAQIATLGQKYQAYKTSQDQLSLSLDDLKAIDCTAEPNGFKATLQDTRDQVKIVQANRKEVTQFAKTSIVASLKSFNGAAETGENR